MGFRALRVINEDWIAGGQGFGMHPHRDMEILTHVLEGNLAHEDSLGSGGTIGAGQWQRMTAGTGIRHSEYNGSDARPVHLYQIWILPQKHGLVPSYEERQFDPVAANRRFQVVASPDGIDGSLVINQDARVYQATLAQGLEISQDFKPGRHGWLQVAKGKVLLDGQELTAGDGAALVDLPRVALKAREDAEVLLFDLA
jgi:redox-sensitive bicupin YhaK (pirin superfamily)